MNIHDSEREIKLFKWNGIKINGIRQLSSTNLLHAGRHKYVYIIVHLHSKNNSMACKYHSNN